MGLGALLPAAVRAGAAPVRFAVAAGEPGRFMAWPANNGLWSWENGREILVGYSDGPWEAKEGHQVGSPQINRLARSLDGGLTWSQETPEPFVGREGAAAEVIEPIRFDRPDTAVRVVAGSARRGPDRLGRFFVSEDRGRGWRGPFRFNGLQDEPELDGLVLTSRTSMVVSGDGSILLLLSAQDPRLGRHSSRLDKTFVVRSDDGGRRFGFVSWVVPWSDRFRAVMPSTVAIGSGRLITVLRRKDPRAGEDHPNWIDAYASTDGGAHWGFLSRVGETGAHNGNPGALARLRDGRLACAYGNRSRREMLLRVSADGGRSWGPERLIRSNPFGFDLGYPQMVQNHRGELVVLYYLATQERPHSFIEAALLPDAGAGLTLA
jgi:hypothetical protein